MRGRCLSSEEEEEGEEDKGEMEAVSDNEETYHPPPPLPTCGCMRRGGICSWLPWEKLFSYSILGLKIMIVFLGTWDEER